MSKMTSPFKFLDSYQQEDANIFFGRAKETEALYEALSGVKHLLVYGPSGAGKTSLIECGLRNQFSDADWYALSIRKGSHISASVFARINEALEEKIELHPLTQLPTDANIDFGQAVEQLFAERYQPVYLLFDQFEELLISGKEDEIKDFFIRLNRLIRFKVPCRVMLIMREEFIGILSEYEELCPSIFQHRFRLEKMRKDSVKKVISATLNAERYAPFFEVNNAERLAESILAKLPDEKKEIELAHVQVFLSELWDRANDAKTGNATPVLSENLIKTDDDLEGVLDSFLKKQLTALQPTHGEKIPLELLATLISERHTKLQLSAATLQQELDHKGIVLQQPLASLLMELENRRIVRTLKSDTQTQYEISHDILALVVGQNLTEEMKMRENANNIYNLYAARTQFFSQDDLDYIRPYKQYKAYPRELGQRIRMSELFIYRNKQAEVEKARRLLQELIVLAGVAVLTSIFAFYKWKNAEVAQKLMDAFYFYDDKFALTYGKKEEDRENSFYFIDKNGDPVKKLGQWKKVEQFNDNSFARVQDFVKQEGLLDTLGNTYLVAYRLEDLNEKITALDLSETNLKIFSKDILKNLQLEILLLNHNYLIELPKEIGKLQGLTSLDLRDNPISIEEQEKIEQWLPNCKIYF